MHVEDMKETHSIITVSDPMLSYSEQLDTVLGAIKEPFFIRFFLSDPATQTPLLKERIHWNCPISIIGQAPMNGTKIAAWVWSDPDVTVCRENGLYKIQDKDRCQYWYSGGLSDEDGSYNQTVCLLDDFSTRLESVGLTLQDNCVRTWFYVQNIDVNYKGMVQGRNSVFDRHNLTVQTHFIASTGIEGRTEHHNNLVMMDAFAGNEKITHLYGLTHLNRTSDYGVRFERGSVAGNHVYISGTASIDNKGQIMHPGDIVCQTHRMIENVRVLLKEAGCDYNNVLSILVYLRDPADYAMVKSVFDKEFPRLPWIILLAPVCRPGWLVEMECIAIKQ